jgi:alpha-glucoside transport system substrate-binding protein
MNSKKTIWFLISLLVLFTLLIAACGPAEAPEEAPEPTAVSTTAPEATSPPMEDMPDVGFAVLPGGFLERAINGEFSGTEVTVDGPFTDPDDLRFFESVEAFEDATGITINYIGDKEFEARLAIAVDAGNPPDIADFPQPGKAANFARQGHIVDPTTWIPESWLRQQYNQSWLDMGMVEGPGGGRMNAGVWHRFNGKSLVWYPKDDFDAAGYTIPETWDELLALTQLIADDGDAAWCIGIESGAATGWAATDWTEELMLRTTSLENYDAWVAGTLPFASPEVKGAIETWSEIWFNPDFVFGGTDGIVSTNFGDSPAPMFEDPPKCWMHKQGNFITGFFPEGAVAGVDYDFFYLPAVDDSYGKPFLVAGDIMSMFNDRPEVRALMEYFTTPQSAAGWLQNGGALAAHLTATPDLYGVDLERGIAALVSQATSFRFDGSDLMPGEVGAGSFWTGMTDYVSGLSDLDTALSEIDASWPEGVAGQPPPSEGPDVGFAVLSGGFLERAINGEFSGTEVTVDGPFTDPDDLRFFESVEAFEDATGITINYIGDKEFEARLAIAVDAGNPPDIADFPQPGKAANFARQGHIVDPTTWIPESWLRQQYNQSWLDMGMVEGPGGGRMNAGVWHRFNGKSLVWYPKDDFDAAGYTIPETWDELLALTQLIADDGDAAWCIGIESGAATGWAATDWTEELMLRTTSLENYDAWVAGTLPFASPEVKGAIETWSEIWFNPDFVFGGTDGIVSTNFGDSPAPMFEDPPKCWMHKQGNFITGFFPEGAVAGVDYDFFYLPAVDDSYGKPFLVAGDIMSMFNDRPEVRALMEYFTTPQSAAGWLQNGGALAAHLTATPDLYGVDLERGIAQLVSRATSFRFDGSDLMPGEVGAGSFWTGMTDYVSGLSDLDTALSEIDASWPQ